MPWKWVCSIITVCFLTIRNVNTNSSCNFQSRDLVPVGWLFCPVNIYVKKKNCKLGSCTGNESILDNWCAYQFLFDSDAQNFRYCRKKSCNFSHALTTPTRDVEKYSQTTWILIYIECNIFDGCWFFGTRP